MSTAFVGGLRLRYDRTGKGDAALFIAGLGNGRAAWDPQVSALQERFCCITYDPRDVGESDLAPAPYTTRDLAVDAVNLLDVLEIPRAHVVGWSMGGAVAQELVIGWPERVDCLALIATYPAGDARGAANLRGWALLRRRLAPTDYQRVIAPWVYSPQEYEQPDLVERAVERALARPPQSQEAFERQVEATVRHDAAGRLGAIRVPTLLLYGSEDVLTPLRFAHALQAGIAGSELVVIAGAGHALLSTRPDEVNTILGRFLSAGTARGLAVLC